jgi:NAD(P)H dehydrogenase (quinone)
MDVLVVLCHPRPDSLTAAVAQAFTVGAQHAGHKVELADLYTEGFDPCLGEEDEPDGNPDKQYSAAVRSEMARVDRANALVLVFPVWWWSIPAMLKGWIDRVWNYGWAYGPRKLPHELGLMIGVAAAKLADFEKRGYDVALTTQLKTGVLDYCGVKSSKLELLCDSWSTDPTVQEALLERARLLGETLGSD